MKNQETLYTSQEVAKYLRLSHATVVRLIKRGEIPAFRFGKIWRIPESSFQKSIKEKTTSGGVNA